MTKLFGEGTDEGVLHPHNWKFPSLLSVPRCLPSHQTSADKGVLCHDGKLKRSTGMSTPAHFPGFFYPNTTPEMHRSPKLSCSHTISPLPPPPKSGVSGAAAPHSEAQGAERGMNRPHSEAPNPVIQK